MIEYLILVALLIATGLLGIILFRINEFIRLIMKINSLKQVNNVHSHACYECDIIEI
jgi:hypothetical protein